MPGQQIIRRYIIAAMNRLFQLTEPIILAAALPHDERPIWIVGPPRSGTTLLYQALIHCYDFAYITNFTSRFYRAPVTATWLIKPLWRKRHKALDFESTYGKTPGWFGPHESGSFWYRWFPKGPHVYVPPNTIPESKLDEFRKEIIGLSRALNAPPLFKNVYNSMRIAPIMEAFPNSSFLVTYRNPVDTAQSILQARENIYGDKRKWVSAEPKEIDEIAKHPYWEQVVEQVYYIYRQVEEDAQRYGPSRFFGIDYEALCANPNRTLAGIERFLEQQSISLHRHGTIETQFSFSTGQRICDNDYEKIVAKASQLWP